MDNTKYTATAKYIFSEGGEDRTLIVCTEHWFDGTENLRNYAIELISKFGCMLSLDSLERLRKCDLSAPELQLIEIAHTLLAEGIPVRVDYVGRLLRIHNTKDTRTYSIPLSQADALKYFKDTYIGDNTLVVSIDNESDFLWFAARLKACIKADAGKKTLEAARILWFANEIQAGNFSFEQECSRFVIQASW